MLVATVLWLSVFLPFTIIPNGMVLSIAILALILVFRKSTRKPTFDFVYRSIPISILVGVLAGTAIFFILDPFSESLAEYFTGDTPDLSSLANVQGDLVNYLILLAIGLLFGGILEEITNRGFLIGWGTATFGERWAIPLMLASAIGFGLAHVWQGPSGMIVTGISGLAFGTVYLLCGRKLLPAITTHAASNFIAITEIYLYGV